MRSDHPPNCKSEYFDQGSSGKVSLVHTGVRELEILSRVPVDKKGV